MRPDSEIMLQAWPYSASSHPVLSLMFHYSDPLWMDLVFEEILDLEVDKRDIIGQLDMCDLHYCAM